MLQIEEKDYKDNVHSTLKRYQQSMNFPGFRKGKAPIGLVKKQLGSDIKREEVNKLIQQEITKFLTEHREEVMFVPIMEEPEAEIDWTGDKDYEFSFKVAFRPDLNIDQKKLKKVESYYLEVTEEELEEEISNLRKQYGDIDRMEVIEDDPDLVVVFRAVELDDKGEDLKDGFTKLARVEAKEMSDKLKNLLLGKKGDEQFTADLKKELTQKELISLFEIEKPALKDLNPEFRIEIQGAIKLKPSELNEELYEKVFGENEIKSEDEFREEVKKNMQRHFEGKDSRHLQSALREKLLKDVNVDLPEEFLKLWFDQNAKTEGMEEEEIQKQYENFLETTKWDLIMSKLGSEYEVEVEEKEIKDSIKMYILQQYGYQAGNLDAAQLDQMADNLYNQENFRMELRQNILEDKVVRQMKNKSIFTEKALKRAEFDEFIKENNL